MKEKTLYLIGACIVIIVTIITILNTGANTEFGSMFEGRGDLSRSKSGGMPVDMTTAPKSVKDTISELESHRSHLSESCIYGAAMILNDLSDEAKQVIDDESKCIHTLVMSIVRNRKLKIAAKRQAQLKIEQEKLITLELESSSLEQGLPN